MTFAEEFAASLNNPACNIMSGMVMGNWLMLKNLIVLFIIYAGIKAIDKLVLTELLDKLRDWLKSRRK